MSFSRWEHERRVRVKPEGDDAKALAEWAHSKAWLELKDFNPREPRDLRTGEWTDGRNAGWGDIGSLREVAASARTVLSGGYRHGGDVPVPGRNAPSMDALPTDVYRNLSTYMDEFNPALGTAYHGDAAYRETLAAIRRVRGRPNAKVTVYRGGVPPGQRINSGDWVTLSRRYAEVIQKLRGGRVVSMEVPAKTVHFGGKDLNEMAYHV